MSNGHMTNIHEVNVKKEKKKIHKNLTTSLINTPITKISYANSPLMYMTTRISNLLPRFVTSDKG